MHLSPEEREKIYNEEKAAREGGNGNSGMMVLLNLLALAGLVGIFFLSKKLEERKVSLEDLRKAYAGLGPEDMP